MSARTPADLRALENRDSLERIAVALEQIAAALAGNRAPPAEYTTHRDGPRPAGYALRRWQKLVPVIPGASQRGRYFVVSRECFEAFERSKEPATTAVTESRQPEPQEQQIARLVGGRVSAGAVRR